MGFFALTFLKDLVNFLSVICCIDAVDLTSCHRLLCYITLVTGLFKKILNDKSTYCCCDLKNAVKVHNATFCTFARRFPIEGFEDIIIRNSFLQFVQEFQFNNVVRIFCLPLTGGIAVTTVPCYHLTCDICLMTMYIYESEELENDLYFHIFWACKNVSKRRLLSESF